MSYGLAKTNAYQFQTAEVMIGPMGSVNTLNPAEHSLGLVKDVVFKTEPTFSDLTQGVTQDVVHTTQTQNGAMVDGTMSEYTPQNLAYAQGLLSPGITTAVSSPTTAAAAIAALSVTVNLGTGFAVGDTISITHPVLINNSHIAKVVSVASNVITFDSALLTAMPIGAVVRKLSSFVGAPQLIVPNYSVKIVSALTNGQSVIILMPKVRISQGLNLTFSGTEYSSNAFSLMGLTLLESEAGFADYVVSGRRAPYRLLIG
jgi:hypothetical protein